MFKCDTAAARAKSHLRSLRVVAVQDGSPVGVLQVGICLQPLVELLVGNLPRERGRGPETRGTVVEGRTVDRAVDGDDDNVELTAQLFL